MASKRPRGFMDEWNPKPDTLETVENVREILADNDEILPLTLRQIFYMLVSGYGFEKTEQAYQRLIETMNKARRARHISMDAIRDDGFDEKASAGWDSRGAFLQNCLAHARDFELDRQDGQETKLIVWCEAQGMAPQLAAAVAYWHIPVLSSGGFDSLTTKHDMAQRIADLDDVEILHIGDHDPSGVHLYKSLDEDLQAFIDEFGGYMELTRLAVTPEQVREMGLPTAPPKRTDRRSFEGLTTQAEAIPPRELRRIVQDAVRERIDQEALDEILAREAEISEELTPIFEDLLR